jgi:hypothetical protein
MNELDLQTEIFDLFGEVGICTICQEDFTDGERARAISKCQHTFHIDCIDNWLSKKGACPLCRAPIIDIARVQTIYHNICKLHTELPVEQHANSNMILHHIQSILELSKPLTNIITELNKYIVNFCIITGIIRKFKTSAEFHTNKSLISETLINIELNGIKPASLDTYTLATLKAYRNQLIYEIKKRTFWTDSVYDMPQIKEVRAQLKKSFGNLLAPIWQ